MLIGPEAKAGGSMLFRCSGTLVRLRTGIKTRIHAILHRQGIMHGFSDLFGKAGRAFLASLPLPEACRTAIDDWLG